VSPWEELERAGVVRAAVPLAALTTYKLGGPARWLAEVDDEAQLEAVAEALRREPLPVLVLGRGSNVVVSDSGFPGLVLRLGGSFAEVQVAGELVRAGGAVPLPKLARSAVAAGRLGLEFYVGIPGSVGGAVRQNAGCFGSETKDVLVTAAVLDLTDGTRTSKGPGELQLSYRHSNLAAGEVVLQAIFRTRAGDRGEGEERMREITRWRREHQPGGTLNAGSVFKNPPGDAAGRIIDQLGLKGLRVGGAAVSEKHANFFVASAGTPAADVWKLVQEVRRRVAEATGIVLEPEIQFVGDFDT
jgi:UDP-N-acetylmuramate dehydrogenase